MYSKKRLYPSDYTIHSTNTDLRSVRDEALVVSIDPGLDGYGIQIISRIGEDIDVCEMDAFRIASRKKEVGRNPNCRKLVDYLDNYNNWLQDVTLVILEEQISTDPCIVEGQTLCYFLVKCPNAIVVTISPKVKGRMLGAPSNLNRTGLKKWSVEKYVEILEERGDIDTLKKLMSMKGRKHDVTDCGIQEQAFHQVLLQLYPQ